MGIEDRAWKEEAFLVRNFSEIGRNVGEKKFFEMAVEVGFLPPSIMLETKEDIKAAFFGSSNL